MNDVAQLAGVSQKTVSRVINNEPAVRTSVRERVLAAARQLGYHRNAAARDLIKGRSHRIGVVSLGTVLHGPASILIGLERAASLAGYSLSVVTTQEGDVGGIQRAVDNLLDQGVEGIVLSEPIDERSGATVTCPVPVVSLGRMPGLRGPDVLTTGGVEQVRAARMATKHLLDLGHATVWHVSGPQRWWAAAARAKGWADALSATGTGQPPILEGDWTPKSGYETGRRLVDSTSVTAIFVGNDDMAIGVIRALTEAGIQVPAQVSVVGMDDIPAAAYLSPALTTVRQDFAEFARRSLESLVNLIESPDRNNRLTGPAVRLIVRQSTAPADTGRLSSVAGDETGEIYAPYQTAMEDNEYRPAGFRQSTRRRERRREER